MKKLTFVGLLGLLLLQLPAMAQEKTRFNYAIKDTDTLYMDHYKPVGKSNGISVMFIHGGAFEGGHPDNQKPMADGLCKLGYRVFVISYRLYLKGVGFGCNTTTPEKLKAVRLAVEDAADATKYLYANARELGIDTTKLVLAGSSAGAETALQLLFNPYEKKDKARYEFFGRQKFAASMIFAGAVLDMNTVKEDKWTPMLLMHGTKDQLVPYGTAAHRFCTANDAGWLMMFGAKTIYEKAQEMNKPCILYTYEGKGHEISGKMFSEFAKMDEFMKSAVAGTMNGQQSVVIPAQ
ncbi:alpha/beta hydrolase [Chitinophaga skermanii]|nr:alpha/beta hydrolase fold domain-containing protein [Chitinophaga skermanii]